MNVDVHSALVLINEIRDRLESLFQEAEKLATEEPEERWIVPNDRDAAQWPRVRCRVRDDEDQKWVVDQDCLAYVADNDDDYCFGTISGERTCQWVYCEIRESDKAKD